MTGWCVTAKAPPGYIEQLTEMPRQHLARLGRKSLSFSKSVELHDKVIGHYLNIKHYQ
ncbi:IS1 family transposase [Escherichia coli]|uniref:IS1 family transposase n=1 Tax=Escherichia coli TaxID=562 RepID=UPI0035CF6DF9